MPFNRNAFNTRADIRYYTVRFGGSSKFRLLSLLESASVSLNDQARRLFASEAFVVSEKAQTASLVELSVEDLGFADGANLSEIFERMKRFGLCECPIEVAPYFRMQYTDQAELVETGKNKAPAGSVTVISKPLDDDEDLPKGFYLRKIDGKLWLRGYSCPMDHVWEPAARLAFRIVE